MKKRFKKIITFLLSLTACVSAVSFAGCGGNNTESGNALRIFVNNGNAFDGVEKDRIWQEIEKKTGAEMSFEGLSHSSAYYTKLNPLMNTINNMPDIVFVVPSSEEMGLSSFSDKWTDPNKGLVYNYDELLERYSKGTYPYIEKLLSSEQYKYIMHNNGHYILPNTTSNSSWGIYFRTDWLINIGYYTMVGEEKIARYPVTIDEYTDVIRKFTFNDPDGNGLNDTYGFCPGKGEHYWNPFYSAFGVTPDWDINADGDLEYMYSSAEFKEFLKWANGLYKEGCIYPTFTSNQANAERDLFYQGKTGMLITNAESHVYFIMKKMTAMGKGDKVGFAYPPVGTAKTGKEGACGFSDWGAWWGGFCITKKCRNIPAALKLLDYMMSPEGSDLRTYGIKDVHYTVENGEIIPNVEERLKEGGGKWEEFNVNGAASPVGRYSLGTIFGYPIDWDNYEKDGSIKFKITAKLIDPENEKMVADAMDKVVLNTSKLVNFTAFGSTVVSVMNNTQEKTKAFVNNAIIGKSNLEKDWDDLIKTVKGENNNPQNLLWKKMQTSAKETLTKMGKI